MTHSYQKIQLESISEFDSEEVLNLLGDDNNYLIIEGLVIDDEEGIESELGPVLEFIEEREGLIIFVVPKKHSRPSSERVVFLPTLHEAEEAIMMNELEKQFRSEMGEE